VKFTIQGVPRGKGRHRTTKTGHTYTDLKTSEYEKMVKWIFKTTCKEPMFLAHVPLTCEIIAYFQRPKSKTKCNINYPTKKPDCDNIEKIICDALNGLAYHDDSQIVEITTKKRWTTDNPRVEVEIKRKIEVTE